MANAEMKPDVYHAPDGCKIYMRSYRAANERAGLVLAHGLGEHSGRYQNLVDSFLALDISVWIPDHRGHGQSDGQRGHVTAFDQYIEDLKGVMTKAQLAVASGRQCFVMGHSMGGLIALRFAQMHPRMAAGVIVSSPALGLTVNVPALKSFLGKIMSSLAPGLSMGNELDATKISHDPEVVAAYLEDPLVHDRVTARWFTEFLGAMTAAHQEASKVKGPILMQLAGDDHLTDSQAARTFFTKLTTEDKTLHWYDGLYHEIYNELPEQRAVVVADLIHWLKAHLENNAR